MSGLFRPGLAVEAINALGFGVLLPLISSCCVFPASTTPQLIDFRPLTTLNLTLPVQTIRPALPEFEVLAAGGIQVDAQRRRTDGVREYLKREARYGAGEHVEVRVIVFESDQRAAAFLKSFCERWKEEGVEWEKRDDSQSCWSPVIESRDDPSGMCISHGTYYSGAAVRRANLLVSVFERGSDPNAVASNDAIAKLADSLGAYPLE